MKQIEIKPEDLIFTRWSEFELLSGLEQLSKSAYWEKVPRIIVLKHPAKEAYLIYNGNHRAMVAKNKKIKIRALLVESEEDLSKIPSEESMYYSDPEHYQEYDKAIARLIKKSEFFDRKQKSQSENPENARETTEETGAGMPAIVKGSVGLLKENNCKKVLDLDCGTGEALVYLGRQGFLVYGVYAQGTEQEMVKKAIEQSGHRNVQLKKGNMRNIPFKENKFDAVIASGGIHNQTMEQIKKTIKEAHRVLKKSGLFFLSVPTKEHPDYGKGIAVEKDTFIDFDNAHILRHYFSEEEIEKEVAPLFKIIKIIPGHSPQEQTRNAPIVQNITARKK